MLPIATFVPVNDAYSSYMSPLENEGGCTCGTNNDAIIIFFSIGATDTTTTSSYVGCDTIDSVPPLGPISLAFTPALQNLPIAHISVDLLPFASAALFSVKFVSAFNHLLDDTTTAIKCVTSPTTFTCFQPGVPCITHVPLQYAIAPRFKFFKFGLQPSFYDPDPTANSLFRPSVFIVNDDVFFESPLTSINPPLENEGGCPELTLPFKVLRWRPPRASFSSEGAPHTTTSPEGALRTLSSQVTTRRRSSFLTESTPSPMILQPTIDEHSTTTPTPLGSNTNETELIVETVNSPPASPEPHSIPVFSSTTSTEFSADPPDILVPPAPSTLSLLRRSVSTTVSPPASPPPPLVPPAPSALLPTASHLSPLASLPLPRSLASTSLRLGSSGPTTDPSEQLGEDLVYAFNYLKRQTDKDLFMRVARAYNSFDDLEKGGNLFLCLLLRTLMADGWHALETNKTAIPKDPQRPDWSPPHKGETHRYITVRGSSDTYIWNSTTSRWDLPTSNPFALLAPSVSPDMDSATVVSLLTQPHHDLCTKEKSVRKLHLAYLQSNLATALEDL